jgi:protein-S-isoprenylcysteine O-methyltransferase Ste14
MSAARTAWNTAKTVMFLLVFWAVFLFALPMGLSIVEIGVGIQRFPPLPMAAGLLLLVFTILAVWAALTLAIAGQGTPLPIDPPATLVTRGPYAYVRHPFALAVTGQVVGLGLAFGSVPVLVYAVVALATWYFLVRPREERALEERFGRRMLEYRRAVHGFRPRLTPYRVR